MSSRTARIAKNTLILYFRQILIMLVSLYTVRVALNILGAEDFGIYNVVGGVVIMFTFLNQAMTSATQRFLNFAMGNNDTEQARNVFSISFIIHSLIALIVVILAETIGLWLFYTLLNIPPDRHTAALVVYHLSVFTTVMNILSVPYRATIIAHEKMSFFAALSIAEVFLRLIVVILLSVILFDKLIVYAFLVSISGIVIFFVNKFYCNKTFATARFRYCQDKNLFRQLAEFSGWSIFGRFSSVGSSHGTNILINIFFGVAVNAAMGIATQVNSAVYSFVTNFQTAFRPQITKSYASKDYDYFMRLIFQSTKVSFFLLLFFVLPLYINAEFVLQLWLKNVPQYAVIFTQMMLLSSLEETIANPLLAAIQATGNIKKYQVIGSCFVFANLPLSLLFLLAGFSPVWVLIIKIGLNALALVWRISFLKENIDLPIIKFLLEVIAPIIIISSASALITTIIHGLFIAWTGLIVSCIVSTLSIVCLVYTIGLNTDEKNLLKKWTKTLILTKTKRQSIE